MIKTKITHNSISTNVSNQTSTHNINDDVPVSTNALPTTGRPVLMTPKGPISMRNMRKEPTQEELVSFQLYIVVRRSAKSLPLISGERRSAVTRVIHVPKMRIHSSVATRIPETYKEAFERTREGRQYNFPMYRMWQLFYFPKIPWESFIYVSQGK